MSININTPSNSPSESGICHSRHYPSLNEPVSAQTFGKHVSNNFLSRTVLQFQSRFPHLFPNEVILDASALGSPLELWILGQTNG